MDQDGEVILANVNGEKRTVTIQQLLPGAFEAGDMDEQK